MKIALALLLALAPLAHAEKGTATATVLAPPADLHQIINDPSRSVVTYITSVQQGPYTIVTVNFN